MNDETPSQRLPAGSHSKVLDFLLGFFGTLIGGFLLGLLGWAISALLFRTPLGTTAGINVVLQFMSVIPTILFIVCVVLSFKKGRNYIGIGMLSTFLLPLLLLGACFLMLAGNIFKF